MLSVYDPAENIRSHISAEKCEKDGSFRHGVQELYSASEVFED